MNEILNNLGIDPKEAFWLGVLGGIVVLIFLFAVWRLLNSLKREKKHYQNRIDQSVTDKSIPTPEPQVPTVPEQKSWICPRCGQEIDEDPYDDETDTCPKCKASLWEMTCPECGKDIWADLATCSECQKPLQLSKCPNCGKQLFVTKYGDCCPYCEETLYICPRCGQYLTEDPAEIEECPVCHKPLATYICPDCDYGNIPVDQKVCPGCQKELPFEQCPECGKSIPSGLDECPCCDESLTVIDCPHCQKEHYVHE